MLKTIDNALDELYDIEGVEACILYRIDGVPINLRISGYKEYLLETMFWLEKHIRQVLMDMNREGLNETIFYFRKNRIIIIPSSQSTVLVTITRTEANQQLISMEAMRTTRIINEGVA